MVRFIASPPRLVRRASRSVAVLVAAGAGNVALAQPLAFIVTPAGTSMSGTVDATANLAGTIIGKYKLTLVATDTRTLNYSFFGTRPPAPTNIAKNISAPVRANGPVTGAPSGLFGITADLPHLSATIAGLDTHLIGATHPTVPVNAQLTYESFLTANPNYGYLFLIALPITIGNAEVTTLHLAQANPLVVALTPDGAGGHTFAGAMDASVDGTVVLSGSVVPLPPTPITVNVTGTLRVGATTATATIAGSIDSTQSTTTPTPLPTDTPFALPPPPGSSGANADVLLNGNITSSSTRVTASITLAGGAPVPPPCPCIADFDASGGTPDLSDITAFFDAWLLGDPTSDADCSGGTPDLTDITVFFGQWLAGGC